MAERDPIDLIKDQLSRWEGMAGLHLDHEPFKQWQSETLMILEKIFTSKSKHYQNFLALRFREVTVKAFASREIDKINTTRYKRDLESAKAILQSAMKELTLDRTLFKKIQTTPKTVEVSLKGEYFISSGITDPEMKKAIQSAFDGSGFKPIQGTESLHEQIERIRRARFGIYDFSKPEVNEVFLELGIALGMRKEVTILYKKSSRLPETIRKLKGIEYENLSELTEKLRRRTS